MHYIDAPKTRNAEKHDNVSELKAIETYIKKNTKECIGIITPYRDQLALIRKQLENAIVSTDSILTVHRSQGREWDTVLFSIVETTNHFFIDSLIQASNGKKLINTAVSRARKKLIIVCDYEYWITQKRQLICKILQKAKPYREETEE